MTKNNNKSRNGHVSSSKGTSDKKVKGEKDSPVPSILNGLNSKVKTRQRSSQSSVKSDQGSTNETLKARKEVNGHVKMNEVQRLKEEERKEKDSLLLWRRPITVIRYFLIELALNIKEYAIKLLDHKLSVILSSIFLALCILAYHCPGPHQLYMQTFEKQALWCLYWLGLGVLSSVGLGTGLHTFLLYLGPHIAAVTLAAYECGSLNFPSPPYPDSIVCSEDETHPEAVTVWSIMAKVRLEAMMWGAGTALGELPPYFMARAARLSALGGKGHKSRRRSSLDLLEADPDSEKLAEFEALKLKGEHPENLSWMDRAKLTVERVVERVGFFGILACASIPNPLFDLAGITCGHFLVPFWTFFGATLIGKAVIKTHLQQLTVIVAFNENLVSKAVSALAKVPAVGPRLQQPLEQLLQSQKAKLHSKGGKITGESGSLLASLFELLVISMVVYFLISIVNSLAQNYHDRLVKVKHVERFGTPSAPANKNRRKAQTSLKKA